jgi:hypothetical protein
MKASLPSIAVVVASCDAYADCWHPFVHLFRRFWAECPFPLFLLSEHQVMDLPACQVIPTARKGESGVSWTERLNRAYDRLPFDYLITFQEDYFLDAPVRHDCLMELFGFMVDSSADRLGLTHFGCRGPFEPVQDRDDLLMAGKRAS